MSESVQNALHELRFEVRMRFPEGFLVQIRLVLVVGECKLCNCERCVCTSRCPGNLCQVVFYFLNRKSTRSFYLLTLHFINSKITHVN